MREVTEASIGWKAAGSMYGTEFNVRVGAVQEEQGPSGAA